MPRAAAGALWVALAILAPGDAQAGCDVIPSAKASFRSARGTTSRPFAAPGEFIEIRVRPEVCDAGSPGFGPVPTSQLVTVLFTPPVGGSPTAVVLKAGAGSCAGFDGSAADLTCESALGGAGARAECIEIDAVKDLRLSSNPGGETRLQVRFPDTDDLFSSGVDNRTLSGPAKIVVTDSAAPLACGIATQGCASSLGTTGLIACIDEFFEIDGTCRTDSELVDVTFPGFTALPPPNRYQDVCTEPDPPCTGLASEIRMATDRDGNLLIPVDWRGILVRRDAVPVPRLLRGSSAIQAFAGVPDPIRLPNSDFTASFSPNGVMLPPIFDPQVDPTAPQETVLFGSVDAGYTVLRLARQSPRSGECSPTSPYAGSPCTRDGDCRSSEISPGTCVAKICLGGSKAGQACRRTGDCPGGACGADESLFDFSTRFAADSFSAFRNGPVLLSRFDPTAGGVCDRGVSEGVACTSDGQCGGGGARCVAYRAEAQDPVPLEGLAGSEESFAFTANEAITGRDLNGDGDQLDTVVDFRSRQTAAQQTLGAADGFGPGSTPLPSCGLTPGFAGRAVVRVHDRGFEYPALVTDGDAVAFLESEFDGNRCDQNEDYDRTDSILRVFELGAGEITPSGLLRAVDAEPHIDGRPLAISGGKVFFRSSEAEMARHLTEQINVSSSEQPSDASFPVTDLYAAPVASMSTNGRFVAFEDRGSNLVNDDTNGTTDIFVRDRMLGTTERISVSSEEQQGFGYSFTPAMSPDGRFVAFISSSQLTSDDTNGIDDVYLRDRELGTTKRASADVTGSTPGGAESTSISIATDGRVAFTSTSEIAGPFPPWWNGQNGAYLYDPGDDSVIRIAPISPTDTEPGNLLSVGLSENGDYVSLIGWDANLMEWRLYLRNILDLSTEVIPTATAPLRPSVTTDARFVFFKSDALYRYDRTSSQTIRIGTSSDLTPHGTSSDGRRVAFSGSSIGDGQIGSNIYVYDGVTSKYCLENVDARGVLAAGSAFLLPVALSPDSQTVVFPSGANLIGLPANVRLYARGIDQTASAAVDAALFADGHVGDTVLEAFNLGTHVLTTLCPATDVSVAGGRAAFLRPESATGTGSCPAGSLNGPGDTDTTDDVVYLWSGSGDAISLGMAATAVSLSTTHVAALASEVDQNGIVLNDDGLADDTVAVIRSVGGPPWISTHRAADTVKMCGAVAALATPERAQNTDLNGDGSIDADDRVLHLFDASSGQLVNLGLAIEDFVCTDDTVAFRARESAQGQNLNSASGDVDQNDLVLYTFDLGRPECRVSNPPPGCLRSSGQAAIPCRLEACDPREPYRVAAATVRFLSFECDQGGAVTAGCPTGGTDLNGDGDAGDIVVQTFNARTGAARVLGAINPAPSTDYDPLGSGAVEGTTDGTVVFAGSGVCVETTATACAGDTQCEPGEFCESNLCRRAHGSCSTSTDCPGDAGGTIICRQDPTVPASADGDGDGIADAFDNCPRLANIGQEDTDGDGSGDACDRKTCGDGQIQLDEACDDGNTVDGDACSADCATSAVGYGCAQISNAKLTLSKLGGTPNDENVTFSGKIQFGPGQPIGFSPLDSLTRGAQLLIEDLGNSRRSVIELSHRTVPVPPGAKSKVCSLTKADGWKANRALTSYTYTNATNSLPAASCVGGSAHGLKTFKLTDKRTGTRPSIDFSVKLSKATISPLAGPLHGIVVLGSDAASGLGGACGEITFNSCASNTDGTTMICR